MSYNHHTSTPPRPMRMIIGFVLASACLTIGSAVSVHQFHQALVLQNEPVEIDWYTLVEQGYGDNPHIRLVDIDLIDPYEIEEDFLAMDDFGAPMMDGQVDSLAALGQAKVIPLGSDEAAMPTRVVLPSSIHALDEGFCQIDETGAITGMVTTYSVGDMIENFLRFMLGEPFPDRPTGDDIVYHLTPVGEAPNLGQARYLFLLLGFGLALGCIVMCSGSPTLWSIWLMPLPSTLTLIGYPLRYGRAGWATRIIYGGAGCALMGYSYYLMVTMGNFGAADGNPVFHAFGFATLFIGLSAVLAIPVQITMRSLDSSTQPAPKKPVRMSWEQACSLNPVEQEIDYEDTPLAPAGSLPLSGDLRAKADALETTGFTKAESMHWQRENGIAPAAIQLGCQSMVITDLEYNNDADLVECNLISVLATGLPILTVSANSSVQQNKPVPKCLFQRASTSDATEMLAEHLEWVVGEAEGRDTVVVEFQEREMHDVVQFGRRVIAELRGGLDGQIVNVGPKRYGRFQFPPTPVPEAAPQPV